MRVLACVFTVFVLAATGCSSQVNSAAPSSDSDPKTSTVLVSVTSDALADPQAVDMAMKLASFALDEGRTAAMFFNVKGVTLPTKDFADDFAFEENDPLKKQLAALIDRGADIHVCPICMKALGVEEGDLMSGAKVTTKPTLFEHIGADTSVFTY